MSDYTKINFTGGFPDSKDLAPSIIFLILYVVATAGLAFRLCRRGDRTKILIYPGLLIAARLGMLVVRAILSKSTSPTEGLFIAEAILVLVGPIFLLHPLVALFKLHVEPHVDKEDKAHWVNRLSKLLHLALLGAVVTGVVAGAQISGALNDPSKMQTVTTLRKVSCVLALVVPAIIILGLIFAHSSFALSRSGTLYLAYISAIMIVLGVYRILNTFSTDSDATVRDKACFWILQITLEYIALISYLSISMPSWFPGYSYEADESGLTVFKHDGSEVDRMESGILRK